MVLNLVIEIMFGCFDAAELGVCAHEGFGSRFWHLYLPASSYEMQYAKCAPGTDPPLSNFLEVIKAVLNVPLRVLVRKIEKMNCASCVCDVDYYVAYLSETVCASVEAE